MEFIKKNYEKVLLGLVLFGLVVAVAFLFILVRSERSAQKERTTQILRGSVKELPPPDVARVEKLIARADSQITLDFSTGNRLFNPERWLRLPSGQLYKHPLGAELNGLEIQRITPLNLVISLDRISESESGVRYGIGVLTEASPRVRRPMAIVSVGEKKEYGDKRESFTVREVVGPTNNPRALVLELSDAEQPITIASNSPYKRVEGYVAEMRYAAPQGSPISYKSRKGDVIRVGEEQYNVVDVAQNEVVLSAKSNNKKTTISYKTAP